MTPPRVVEIGVADRKVVVALVEDLCVAWQTILNDYAAHHKTAGTERGGPRRFDAWMAVHNFAKLALDQLVDDGDLAGETAAQFYLGAGETFMKAMRLRAEQMRRAAD